MPDAEPASGLKAQGERLSGGMASAKKRHAFDRSSAGLLVAWLVKDLGWVLMLPFVSIPAACVAILCSIHILRTSLRNDHKVEAVHDMAELCWLFGNALWMASEMMFDSDTSKLPWSFVPVVGVGHKPTLQACLKVSVIFFALGFVMLMAFYVPIWMSPPPESSSKGHNCLEAEETVQVFGRFPLHIYSRSFIGFWIAKDLCWILENCYRLGVLCGLVALIVVVDASRRRWRAVGEDGVSYGDFVVLGVLMTWITGNVVWMTEELPLEEQHPTYRVVVAGVFLAGFSASLPLTCKWSHRRCDRLQAKLQATVAETTPLMAGEHANHGQGLA